MRHIRLPERGTPAHFAGRKAELRELMDFVRANDARAGIKLVSGIPGVGKTELVRRFVEHAKAEGLVAITPNTIALGNGGREVFLDIASAMGVAGETIADPAPKPSGRQVRVAGTGYGETTDHARHQPDFDSMMRQLPAAKRSGLWKKHRRGVAVVIDELQNIDGEGAKTLKVLHEGRHGCPVFVVGAGLQHTPRVLAGFGMSRIDSPIRLGPLDSDDAREAIAQGFSKATQTEMPQASVQVLAERSFNFPQHIVGYLDGALKAYDSHGHVDGPALVQAIAHGDERRQSFYDQRLENAGGIAPLLGLVEALDARSEITEETAVAAVAKHGRDGQAIIDAAVKHGVVTLSADSLLRVDIPSFLTHLKDTAAKYRSRSQRWCGPGGQQSEMGREH